MIEYIFNKQKVATNVKVNEVFLNEVVLVVGQESDDFFKETFTVQLEAFLLDRLNERQEITVWRKPQKFWDWLLRRNQMFKFEFSSREVLKNPPSLPKDKSTLMFTLEEL